MECLLHLFVIEEIEVSPVSVSLGHGHVRHAYSECVASRAPSTAAS